MAYIGTPPSNAFTSLLKQDFSTSATTGYTLDHAVNNANDIALFINFVRQEPTAAYSASGTTLTLTEATSSSDDMYCVYLGKAVQTVNPPNSSVGLSQLTATGTKDATTFLRGDNTFAVAGGDNTPSFLAKRNSAQSIPNNTDTKIQYNVETYDTNSAYDASTNYRFTVPSGHAGKYFLCCSGAINDGNDFNHLSIQINKNGSTIISYDLDANQHYGVRKTQIIDDASEGDYYEVYLRHDYFGGNRDTYANTQAMYFFGYKIIE